MKRGGVMQSQDQRRNGPQFGQIPAIDQGDGQPLKMNDVRLSLFAFRHQSRHVPGMLCQLPQFPQWAASTTAGTSVAVLVEVIPDPEGSRILPRGVYQLAADQRYGTTSARQGFT